MTEQKVITVEALVSFDVSALFTSIPVPVALEVRNRSIIEHIDQTENKTFWKILSSYQKAKLSPFWN